MLYSYAGFHEKSWAIFDRSETVTLDEHAMDQEKGGEATVNVSPAPATSDSSPSANAAHINMEDRAERETRVKMNVMSGLSIILTLMSILVAYTCVHDHDL